MKFGLYLPNFGPLASAEWIPALAQHAEGLGFDSIWAADNIVYPPQYAERLGSEFYEAVTTLAYVAALTRHIRIGTAVLVLPYRNPLILAKALATLDVFSQGRLIVGVGVGSMAEEYAALGAPFADRGTAADEYLRIIRTLWTQEHPKFSGKFFRFSDVLFAPRPVQQPSPPIWVGGNSSRALRRVAELGDGWLPIWHAPTGRGFTPETLREKVAEIGELAGRFGRRVRHEVAGIMPLAIPGRQPMMETVQPLVGPPERLVEMLRQYKEAGLSHVILSPGYGVPRELLPKNLAEAEQLLRRFVSDVRPHV